MELNGCGRHAVSTNRREKTKKHSCRYCVTSSAGNGVATVPPLLPTARAERTTMGLKMFRRVLLMKEFWNFKIHLEISKKRRDVKPRRDRKKKKKKRKMNGALGFWRRSEAIRVSGRISRSRFPSAALSPWWSGAKAAPPLGCLEIIMRAKVIITSSLSSRRVPGCPLISGSAHNGATEWKDVIEGVWFVFVEGRTHLDDFDFVVWGGRTTCLRGRVSLKCACCVVPRFELRIYKWTWPARKCNQALESGKCPHESLLSSAWASGLSIVQEWQHVLYYSINDNIESLNAQLLRLS